MSSNSKNAPFTVDVFCRVIDNFGDAGVCLRLSRALVLHHGFAVRLWCDDVALLHCLEPQPAAQLSFHDWVHHPSTTPAQGVICGFGCTLDDAYLQAMANLTVQGAQPTYLHLEYLSAEPWVETTHGLWSTHPRLGLKQRFCNPGFTVSTAGLLHEATVYSDDHALQTLRQYGAVPANVRRIFVFGYPSPAFDNFIVTAQLLTQPMHWVLPQGQAGHALHEVLQNTEACHAAGHTFTCLPFVSQVQFDQALRSCDLAWVRGEDSAVTAMFAGIPMLWQLYPQDDGAHLTKLAAYLSQHRTLHAQATSQMQTDTAVHESLDGWCAAMNACNGDPQLTSLQTQRALLQFLTMPTRAHAAIAWSQHCHQTVPDLAQGLSRWLREWKIL